MNSLVSSYLRKGGLEDFVQKEQFFKLIQLLSFLRTLGYSRQFLDNQAYCVVEFTVMDFIGFTGGDMKSTYQRTLTALGKKLVDDRKQDFNILFVIKKVDGYVFSDEKNQYKPLRRDTLTKEINLVLRKVGERLDNKPNLTSHSFRIGFITQLWRDTGDIEFVRQAI